MHRAIGEHYEGTGLAFLREPKQQSCSWGQWCSHGRSPDAMVTCFRGHLSVRACQRAKGARLYNGYDGSIWPHHDGFMWLHLAAPVTVRYGPVSSGTEEKGLVGAGAK